MTLSCDTPMESFRAPQMRAVLRFVGALALVKLLSLWLTSSLAKALPSPALPTDYPVKSGFSSFAS